MENTKTKFEKLKKYIKILLAAGLIVAIFMSVEIEPIINRLISIRPFFIVLVGLLVLIGRVLMAYKWHILLKAYNIGITVGAAIKLYFMGSVFGTLTPGAVGGEIFKVAYLTKEKKNKAVISTLILERFLGLCVLGVIALAVIPFSMKYMGANTKVIIISLISVILIFGITLFLLYYPNFIDTVLLKILDNHKTKLLQKMHEFFKVLTEFRHHKNSLYIFILLTFVKFVSSVFVFYFGAKSIGVNLSLLYFVCIVPIVQILIRIPISPQGIGIQEGLFAFFFVNAGYLAEDGVSLSILMRGVDLIFVLLPGYLLFLLNSMDSFNKQIKKTS